MGLSDDQRAMLRLLAQREEGYEDIAALMGIGVDEVRAKVREALAELGERPTAPPAGEAVASAPGATAAPRPAPPPATRSQRSPRALAPPRDRRRLLELVGGALIALLIVLFATGAVDIGGDSDGEDGASVPSAATRTNVSDPALTQAVLEPVGGGEASGRALFGRIRRNVVLQVEAQGLEPSSGGQSYAVWLARSPQMMVPVGTTKVGASGALAAQLPVPAAVLVLLAQGTIDEIAVTRTSDAALQAAVRKGRRQGREPEYTGTDVLRGEITGPFVGTAGRAGR